MAARRGQSRVLPDDLVENCIMELLKDLLTVFGMIAVYLVIRLWLFPKMGVHG